MIQRLKTFLESKGYTLAPQGDCYLVTSPSGKTVLANLRWKTKPVFGRRAKPWEWSIPFRDWERYLATGVACLFVLETSTGKVYVARMTDVATEARHYYGDDLDHGGTVFLPLAKYKRLATLAL